MPAASLSVRTRERRRLVEVPAAHPREPDGPRGRERVVVLPGGA